MKIAIVVPAYNEEKSIGRTIESLLRQSEKPSEIIVVDNNSIDDTSKVSRYYPVRVLMERHQGVGYARNRGFRAASAEVIVRCDADTIVPRDWIARIKHNFQTKKIDALTGPGIYYDLPFRTTFYSNLYLDIMKFIQRGETLLGPNMALRKSIWLKVEKLVCQDEKGVFDDVDLALHILKVGGTIGRDNKLVVLMSGRRIKKNPYSFFVKYPLRLFNDLRNHLL